MAASLFLMVSRRLQAPMAALLVLGGLQLAAEVMQPASKATTLSVRGAFAVAQTAAARS